jgi:HlyD family secretion protein
MQRRTLFITLTLGTLSGAALIWALMPQPLTVSVVRPTLGPFEQRIDDEGRTRVRDRYRITTPVAGRMTRLAWREGDWLQQGTVITTLWPSWPALQDARTLAELTALDAASQANLDRARSRLARATLIVQQAQNTARRSDALAVDGYVSASQRDVDRLALASALQDRVTAETEVRQAYHESMQRQAARSLYGSGRTADNQRPITLTAPINGQVLRILQPDEGMVPAGAALLELGDLRQLEVVAELLTTDALKVRAGDAVRIDGWGKTDALHGTVRAIEPAAFTKVSALGVEEQRVNVLIDLAPLPPSATSLGDEFQVSVHIILSAQAQAVRIPAGGAFPVPVGPEHNGPAPWAVFVVEHGRARLRPVTLGGHQDGLAWITKGLTPNDDVVLYPPNNLSDGQRVRRRTSD